MVESWLCLLNNAGIFSELANLKDGIVMNGQRLKEAGTAWHLRKDNQRLVAEVEGLQTIAHDRLEEAKVFKAEVERLRDVLQSVRREVRVELRWIIDEALGK